MSQVHQAPNLPQPARTGRVYVAVSQPAQRCVVGAQSAVSQRIGTVSQAQRPYRGHVPRASPCALCHAHRNVSQRAKGRIVGAGRRVMAWPPGRVATQLPAQPLPPITIHLGVLRYSSQQPPSLQYNPSHSSSCSHDIMFVS